MYTYSFKGEMKKLRFPPLPESFSYTYNYKATCIIVGMHYSHFIGNIYKDTLSKRESSSILNHKVIFITAVVYHCPTSPPDRSNKPPGERSLLRG